MITYTRGMSKVHLERRLEERTYCGKESKDASTTTVGKIKGLLNHEDAGVRETGRVTRSRLCRNCEKSAVKYNTVKRIEWYS